MDLKKYPLFFGTIFFISIFLYSCSGQNTPTNNPGSVPGSIPTLIKIGVDPNLANFETIDPAGKIVGFDIDVIKAAGTRAQVQIELVKSNAGLNQVLAMVENCELDGGISAIPISDSIKKRMEISDPYYSSTHVLVVKKGNIKISGLDTLSGMVVGTEAGTPSQDEVENIPAAQPKYYETFFLAFEDLINGNIDAVIADKPRADNYVKIKPNNLKIVGEPFGSVEYGIALCRNQADLLKQINDGLAALKADGSIEKLEKKWLVNIAP